MAMKGILPKPLKTLALDVYKRQDMQLKCQYLSEINDGRGIVFATGTPITNTMCEMYVMQLYLQKAALEEMGIYHFDSWAENFGEVTTALELTVEAVSYTHLDVYKRQRRYHMEQEFDVEIKEVLSRVQRVKAEDRKSVV